MLACKYATYWLISDQLAYPSLIYTSYLVHPFCSLPADNLSFVQRCRTVVNTVLNQIPPFQSIALLRKVPASGKKGKALKIPRKFSRPRNNRCPVTSPANHWDWKLISSVPVFPALFLEGSWLILWASSSHCGISWRIFRIRTFVTASNQACWLDCSCMVSSSSPILSQRTNIQEKQVFRFRNVNGDGF